MPACNGIPHLALSRHLLPQKFSYFLDNPTQCSISVGDSSLTLKEKFQPARTNHNALLRTVVLARLPFEFLSRACYDMVGYSARAFVSYRRHQPQDNSI